MQKTTYQELARPSATQFAEAKKLAVTVVLDQIRSAHNVGSFFRTCDAFGIERIVLCGISAVPPSREIHKSALGAELTVAWEHRPDTAEAVEHLKQQGYTIVAVEQVRGAHAPDRFPADPAGRYALVFGNEVEGVSQTIVDRCDTAIEIPQVGTKHSLNVAVSGGVVLWEFFKRLAEPQP